MGITALEIQVSRLRLDFLMFAFIDASSFQLFLSWALPILVIVGISYSCVECLFLSPRRKLKLAGMIAFSTVRGTLCSADSNSVGAKGCADLEARWMESRGAVEGSISKLTPYSLRVTLLQPRECPTLVDGDSMVFAIVSNELEATRRICSAYGMFKPISSLITWNSRPWGLQFDVLRLGSEEPLFSVSTPSTPTPS